ncbi:hypothetical protein SBRCBS47491_000249 [Sporothrix bragantina]|uniref:2-dehydropantoate 2-reductase n=1 Tax=Sporothrix bragantina TaxID=671064 RepID=A0ABP0ANR0_9PEZI
MAPPLSAVADPARPVHIVFPEHNINVSLIGRSNYAALAKDGVQLQTRSFGDYTFHPHAVFPSVTAAASPGTGSSPSPPEGGWDFVVVTTKALPDRVDDSATIAPLVGPSSTIVLIQNGVGVEAPYRARFPQTPIISGVTIVSAEQIRPGTIRQNRWTRLHIGPYTSSAESSSSPDSTSTLTSAKVDENSPLTKKGVEATSQLTDWWTRLGGIRDIDPLDEVGLQTVRWHKLCINAAFNPSAVLSGGRGNADMASDPELRIHLKAIMDEIWEAAPRILGRPFPTGFASPDKILQSTDRNKGARPSMLLDWEAGRPLELEVIVGNPVRIARARGVELPRMQTLYALLRSAQLTREKTKDKGKL